MKGYLMVGYTYVCLLVALVAAVASSVNAFQILQRVTQTPPCSCIIAAAAAAAV